MNGRGLTFWPVGDIHHGFGSNISYNQVKPIILITFLCYFFCVFMGTLSALLPYKKNDTSKKPLEVIEKIEKSTNYP